MRKNKHFIKIHTLVIILVLAFATIPVVNVAEDETLNYKIVQIDNPSPQAGALFGSSVESIGDVDGDGIGEIVVGAPGADKVYLLSGSDQSLIRVIEDPAGLTGYDFGYSVSGVGDLDGDGVGDLAIGAPCTSMGGFPLPPPTPAWGRAFIFSGATGALIYDVYPGISFIGEPDEFLKFGFAVASLGDITGDGTPDFAVSAPVITWSAWGEVYAFSGADGSQLWVTGEPGHPGNRQRVPSFGYFMNGIEDITGDGHKDLLVGAPYHDLDPDPNVDMLVGEGYVLSGYDGSIFRTHVNPSPVYNDLFGYGPAGIGDQNGDGIEDYIFGEAGTGIVHLYSGATGDKLFFYNNQIESPSEKKGDFFGYGVAKTDDKDGDGLVDFWVSAPKDDKVYLTNHLGHPLIEVERPNPVVHGSLNGFGRSISTTDDLDGKSGLDLIVGTPNESIDGFDNAGAVFLVLEVTITNRVPYMAWVDQFGPSETDRAYGISVDSSGVYVAGAVEGFFPGQKNYGGIDAFVSKYDTDGSEVWTRQFGSKLDDYAWGISVYSSGVYVVGEVNGALPGQSRKGGIDAFLRKYDTYGNEIWTHQIGTSEIDKAFCLSVDSSGVYVAGTTFGSFPSYSNAGGCDGFIEKYTHDGFNIGRLQYGTSQDDSIYGISVSPSGLYVAGKTHGRFPSNTFSGGYDAFISKFNLDGDEKWTKQFGSDFNDCAEGVGVDSSGVYITGHVSGALANQNYEGDYDVFIRKYDFEGNEEWTHQFGSYFNDNAFGISLDVSGVYITGYTNGALTDKVNEGATDVFVRKYNPSGDEMWTYQFGTEVEDCGYGISVDPPGIYVAGATNGEFQDYIHDADYDSFMARLGTIIFVITPMGNDRMIHLDKSVWLEFDKIIKPGFTDLKIIPDIPELEIPDYTIITPCYEITTTARFIKGVNLHINYDEAKVPFGKEKTLSLFQYKGNEWVDVTTTLDMINKYISGSASSFSLFAIAYREKCTVEIDINPSTLNLRNNGRWISCQIRLPEGYDINDIDVSTILLEDIIPVELWPMTMVVDKNNDNPRLLVKFDRSEVEDMLSPGTYNLKVTGELGDGTVFEGSDVIRVI